MPIAGRLIIGASRVEGGETFNAMESSTGRTLAPPFIAAGPADVARACRLAEAAFDSYRETDPKLRAAFLENIADRIDALGALLQRAEAETGLARMRLEGERARTSGQLRLFARTVRQGDWVGVRIDSAQPERKPAPRPDLRQRAIPLGPVAVFGASNFPLAFSVAGGDTASALAAGCPVIVKGHPAHPGTSELIGEAIADAVAEAGVPEGVFSLLNGPSKSLGAALVSDPRVRAVAFTGSRAGGLALAQIASARPEPIVVYAEMSSVNPVILLPGALKARSETMARAFVSSLTLGAGQFCTNPGVILAAEGAHLDHFEAVASSALSAVPPVPMLTRPILDAYEAGVNALAGNPRVKTVFRSTSPGDGRAGGALFATAAEKFLADRGLRHEVFGAAAIIVRCPDVAGIHAVLNSMEGQLTATVQLEEEDYGLARSLLPLLELRAGRIIVNGWPTGVEVCDAMVHGGPYPATSDSRSTSVGSAAISRFLRPVCYQGLPEALLPEVLHDRNPWRVHRLIDGEHAAQRRTPEAR